MREKVKVYSEAVTKVGDKYVCVSIENNLIYTIDENSGATEIVGMIPEEKISDRRLCGALCTWRKKLVFIPFNAKKIWILDLETEEWCGINLKNPDIKIKSLNAIVYEDFLYIIPLRYPALVIVNLKTLEIIEDKKCIIPNKSNFDDKFGFFCGNVVVENGKIYAASCSSNAVLIYDMKRKEYEWKQVGSKGNGYVGIAKYRDDFWLAPRVNTPIVKWNGEEKIQEYELSKSYLYEYNFMGIVGGDRLNIIGYLPGKSLVLEEGDRFANIKETYGFSFGEIIGEEFITYSKNGIIEINKKNKIKSFKTYIAKNKIEEFIDINKEKYKESFNGILKETQMFGINEFIECLGKTERKG